MAFAHSQPPGVQYSAVNAGSIVGTAVSGALPQRCRSSRAHHGECEHDPCEFWVTFYCAHSLRPLRQSTPCLRRTRSTFLPAQGSTTTLLVPRVGVRHVRRDLTLQRWSGDACLLAVS